MNITINEAFYRRHLHHLRPSERGLFLSLIVVLLSEDGEASGTADEFSGKLNVSPQFFENAMLDNLTMVQKQFGYYLSGRQHHFELPGGKR